MAISKAKRQSRKSFLGRLKPLLGRLRGKEPRVRSPTSVADFLVEPPQSQHGTDPPVKSPEEQEDCHLHLDDYGTVLIRENEEVLSSFSQSTTEKSGGAKAITPTNLSSSREKSDNEISLSTSLKAPGQLLRDFSRDSPFSDRLQRSTPREEQPMFRPVSPMRPLSDASTSFEHGQETTLDDLLVESFETANAKHTHFKDNIHVETVQGKSDEESNSATMRENATIPCDPDCTSSTVYVSTLQNLSDESPSMLLANEGEGGAVSRATTPEVTEKNSKNDNVSTVDNSPEPMPPQAPTDNLDREIMCSPSRGNTDDIPPQSPESQKEIPESMEEDYVEGNIITDDNDKEDPPADSSWEKGVTVVDIVAPTSQYKGKKAMILDVKQRVKVRIYLDQNNEKETWLPRTSLSYEGLTPFPTTGQGPDTSNNAPGRSKNRMERGSSGPADAETSTNQHSLQPGKRIYVSGGLYKQRYGTIVKVNNVMVTVKIDGLDGNDRSIRQTNVTLVDAGQRLEDPQEGAFQSRDTSSSAPNPQANGQASEENHKIFNASSKSKTADESNSKDSRPVEACTTETAQGLQRAQSGNGKNPFQPGVRVLITGSKKYKNLTATVVKLHSIMVTLNIDGRDDETRLNQKNISLLLGGERREFREAQHSDNNIHNSARTTTKPTRGRKQSNQVDIQVDDWKIVDADKGSKLWGRRKHVRSRFQLPSLVTSSKKRGLHDNFLEHLVGDRLHIVEIPLNKVEIEESAPARYSEDGCEYELISAKTYSDNAEGSSFGSYRAPEKVVLFYCKVSGPGLESLNLREELEKIADFGCLDPAKTVCRLELLQSTAKKFQNHPTNNYGIFPLDSSWFGEIEEAGNEGCGFICEDLLVNLLGGNAMAKRTCAIQVRMYVPKIGVMKGVLCKKRISSGSHSIQVPPSMIKVGPSKKDDYLDRALLLITKNGICPNDTNEILGRLLSQTNKKDTTKSFRKKLKEKKLSNMILRLWQGLGVPEQDCKNYAKESQNEKFLQHAFVLGMADPTGELPPGTIFVSGFPDAPSELFVSRSPCVEHDDGRIIKHANLVELTEMTEENKEFLRSLPFGCIIYANPRPGETPMPVLIADGDLDGDLYFICWNQRILEKIQATPMNPTTTMTSDVSASNSPYNVDWLVDAQTRMVALGTGKMLSHVIGKLYNAAQKIAAESEDFINDEDYKSLAQAYKEALKLEKHGGKVHLPLRLYHCIPEKYHCMLEETGEEQSEH